MQTALGKTNLIRNSAKSVQCSGGSVPPPPGFLLIIPGFLGGLLGELGALAVNYSLKGISVVALNRT